MRKLLLPLVGLALGLMAVTAASASAATSCETTGTIKLSPGLTSKAQVQNVSLKGTLSGPECAAEGEGGAVPKTFTAHYKTEVEVTCAVLTGTGAPIDLTGENKIIIKSPKSGNSMGVLDLPLTEVGAVGVSGSLESGPFGGAVLGGSVSQRFTGGAECGVSSGKKKAKAVKKGTFAGSLTF